MVDGIQRIYDGGWDPSGESDNNNKSEQVKQCMDLRHCLHWLHLEPTHLPPILRQALGPFLLGLCQHPRLLHHLYEYNARVQYMSTMHEYST
jgi:hypothetical protein